jgi:hypothetical protein
MPGDTEAATAVKRIFTLDVATRSSLSCVGRDNASVQALADLAVGPSEAHVAGHVRAGVIYKHRIGSGAGGGSRNTGSVGRSNRR